MVHIPCPSQNSEGEWMLSADYWHEVKEQLRETYGDIFVLPQCAAAGDLSPRTLHYHAAQERRYRLKYEDYQADSRLRTPREMLNRKDIANRICEAFREVYSWASKEKFTDLPVVHSVKTIQLDRRLVTEEEYAFCCREKEQAHRDLVFISDGEPIEIEVHNTKAAAATHRYDEVIERYHAQQESTKRPTEVHIVKVGDIAFATNPFELYMDYQHRIQARSPFVQTFVVQLAAQPGNLNNGTYLCTERGAWGMGYSATVFCNAVSPAGGQQLVEETVAELKKIY